MIKLSKDELEKATAIYAKGIPQEKAFMEKLFGNIFNQDIRDKVKTFEDACQIISHDPREYYAVIKNLAKHQAAYIKLALIIQVLNEGWKPDWTNASEYKYCPYFEMKNGFSLFGVYCDYTSSGMSSRLCFKSHALAEYAAKQFLEIYKDYFINN